MMKNILFLFFPLLLLASACRQEGKDTKEVLHINLPEGLETTDPAFAKNKNIMWLVHQLYNTLVQTDSSLQIRPSLAKSWDVSADGRCYTFHLRTDVYFQDNAAFPQGKGRRLTADDVVYSFRRITDPQTASSGAWIFNGKIPADSGFVALDDSTFRLRLLQPFHPIFGILSMPYCSIVAHEAVEKYGKDFRRHPCGSGPFSLKYWDEGQVLILMKNPRYFEKDSLGHSLPYLDAVKFTFVDSKATEFLLFSQGQLDVMNDVDISYKDELLTRTGALKKEFRGKIVLEKHTYLNTEYLGILVDSSNTLVKHAPLRLQKIRLAINEGFDRDRMMKYLRNNIGVPAHAGFVPEGLPSFDAAKVKGYRYDPAHARQLLAEAGFPNGKGLPVIRLYSSEQYADLTNYIAGQLQETGIPVQVEIQQISMLREMAAKSQAAFFRANWIADYPDAESFLTCFYGKNPAPPNYTRFSDPQFDRLYEQALAAEQDSVRYHLYREMDRIILREAPIVPLYYDQSIRFLHLWVKGLKNNGLNMLELRHARIVK